MKNWTREESKHSRERLVMYTSPCKRYTLSRFYTAGFSYPWTLEYRVLNKVWKEFDSFKAAKNYINDAFLGE